MVADSSLNQRQGVGLLDDLVGFLKLALAGKCHIGRDILVYWTGIPACCLEQSGTHTGRTSFFNDVGFIFFLEMANCAESRAGSSLTQSAKRRFLHACCDVF